MPLDRVNITQRDRLLGMLQEQYPKYHPIIAMAEMAHDRSCKEEIVFQCHKTIARYVESELKAVEVRTDTAKDYGQLRVVLEGEVEEVVMPKPMALEAPEEIKPEANDLESLLDIGSLKPLAMSEV